jgi:hypothetical protein
MSNIVLCNGVLKNGNPCRYKAKQGMFCKIHYKVSSTYNELKNDKSCVQKETCSICYDKDVDCSLSCKHSFCKCCITKWLKKNDKCPLCRTTVKDVDFENLNIREDSITSSKVRSRASHRARIRALRAHSRARSRR